MEKNQFTLAYLACPYSHPDSAVRHMRHMIVNRVACELHKQGKFVYSPLTHNIPLIQLCDKTIGWDFWEKFDKMMIMKSDRLLVLTIDGWRESKGVAAEIKFAEEFNLPIDLIDVKAEFGLSDQLDDIPVTTLPS
jgi:hypothetical protein